MSELQACPFCGNEARVERPGTPRQSHIITCDQCGCTLETNEKYEAENFEWNRRPIEDALRARIAELEELVNGMENSPPPSYCCVFCDGYEECLPDCKMMRVMGMVWIPNDKCTAGGAWWEMDSPQGKEYLAGKAD